MKLSRSSTLVSLRTKQPERLVRAGHQPVRFESFVNRRLQLGRKRRLADGVADDVEARHDPGGQLLLAGLGRYHPAEELLVGSLDEGRQRLAWRRQVQGAELVGHGDLSALVVRVVGAERDHQAARDAIGKDVLQFAEIGRLGAAEAARVLAAHLSQIDRHRLAQVDLGAVDMQPRSAARQAAVRGARLVTRVLLVHGAVRSRHRRGFLENHSSTRRRDKEDLLSVVRLDLGVGVRPEYDVRDAERARQELHVRQHVALTLSENAGGRVEVGGRFRQDDDLFAREAARLGRHAQPSHCQTRVEGAQAGIDLGAEQVVADALPALREVVQVARYLGVEQKRRAAQDVVADAGRLRQHQLPGRQHLGKGEHGVGLRPLHDALVPPSVCR